MNQIMSFFGSVRNEMKKVRWPNKKEMTKFSIATLGFIVIFALFFFVVDLVLAGLRGLF